MLRGHCPAIFDAFIHGQSPPGSREQPRCCEPPSSGLVLCHQLGLRDRRSVGMLCPERGLAGVPAQLEPADLVAVHLVRAVGEAQRARGRVRRRRGRSRR